MDKLEWLAETMMIPIWLASEWLADWFPRWQKAIREARTFLAMTVPGWWE